MGGGGRVLLCTQRDQLDCPPPNDLNHYLPLNKTGAHSTGEQFRATMALLFKIIIQLSVSVINSFNLIQLINIMLINNPATTFSPESITSQQTEVFSVKTDQLIGLLNLIILEHDC